MIEFHNGQMVDFSHAFVKSVLNILDYEDYDSECNILKINSWLGWDGSGSHKQFSNSDIDINTRNLINGGYRIFEITNHTKDFEWVELSQSHETFEPYFLIPGTESETLVREISKKVDFDAWLNKDLDEVKFRGRYLILHTHFSFISDGKLLELCSGSGGAHCISCTKSKADHLMFAILRQRIPADRTNQFLSKIYQELRKTKSGAVATKTGKFT